MIFDFTFPHISSKMLPHFMDLGKFWSIIIILEAITININYINLNIIIIDGHTDLKPCYVAPLNKSTVDEPLTRQWSSAPLGYLDIDENESRLKWKRDVRLCEHYYIAGNLHSWYWVYSKIWKINIMSMKLIFWWAYMEHLCYFLGAICGQWDCKWICQQQILVIWKMSNILKKKRTEFHIIYTDYLHWLFTTLHSLNFCYSWLLIFAKTKEKLWDFVKWLHHEFPFSPLSFHSSLCHFVFPLLVRKSFFNK